MNGEPMPLAKTEQAKTGMPGIALVSNDRPWRWLAAGWQDLMAVPHLGFVYGGAVVVAGWVLVVVLLQLGSAWAILPATAGFFVVAPLLGAGLYEVSRRRERGEETSFLGCAYAFRRNGTQLALIGTALLLIHLFWIRIAGLLFALFFGLGFSPAIESLPIAMLRSDNLLPFLVIGTGFGFVLACVSFAISAVSIPMIIDRDISAFEAVAVSVTAVMRNWRAMALWAGLIVVFTAMALVPFFFGLALVLPLIGHATWHCYRDLVR
ncbi:DUF2189 domain-containing protein [Falsiroseomonas stagni]|uniref:Uncharacterized membrane protein n=1 Tax=Falsiroseomonas stagni DSM 19981 TaxID=1123062 RepID=A0A1I3YH26_9PROT|nr:DUF2189 domain-containing protein [Falsiroseomonas stagni]SFK30506.1 Uncharacterized membrane protein [Falsiroseomonas stagni DSM 19981]